MPLVKIRRNELKKTNEYRAKHHANPLRQNPDLTEVAQKWCEKLAKENNGVKHNPHHDDGFPEAVGENIAAQVVGGGYKGGGASSAWYREIKDYNFKTGKSNNKNATVPSCRFANSQSYLLHTRYYNIITDLSSAVSVNYSMRQLLLLIAAALPCVFAFPKCSNDWARQSICDFAASSCGQLSTITASYSGCSVNGDPCKIKAFYCESGGGEGGDGDGGGDGNTSGDNGGGGGSGGADGEDLGGPCKGLSIEKIAQNELAVTNKYRTNHHVAPLIEDAKLTKLAQGWCDQIARRQSLEHNSNRDDGFSDPVGENVGYLWLGPNDRYNGGGASKMWYEEVKDYNFSAGQGPDTGHFTQLVWKATTKVGHGISYTSKCDYVYVCANYITSGNWGDTKDYIKNVLPK